MILTESTSIAWIRKRLTQVCNIDTTGRHLPKILNIKFNRDEESPAAFMELIKSSFTDSLMPAGTKYHGHELTTPETLNPTLESFIVIQCLKAIHPDLPEFIMNNKGMLFTSTTPNFCDIQQELCDTMDTILAQMEAHDSINKLQAIDSTETLRWANSVSRGRPMSRRPQQRPGIVYRSNLPQKRQQQKQSCDYCVALGKDEKIWATHDKLNCYDLFPEKKTYRS